MLDYTTFLLITSRTIRKTHCSGKNGTPPELSASAREKCDAEGGCKANGGAHHECCYDKYSSLYCECEKNKDRSEAGYSIAHYFPKNSGMDNNLCVFCQTNCDQR